LIIENQLKPLSSQTELCGFNATHDIFHKLLLLIIKQREKSQLQINYDQFFHVFEQFAKQLCKNFEFMNKRIYKRYREMEEFDDHLVLFSCYLILYATEIEPTIAESQTKFETRKIIYDLIRRGLKCYISRYSLLNLVTSTRSNLIYSNRISFAAVKLLVECGATTDASTLNTPLHIAMSLPFVSSDEEPERLNIAKYLLDEAKAHIDSRNEDGHTPMDCCIIDNVAKHICPLKYMTLKCFAAQSLRKFNLSYRHMGLSHTMETFVDTH
jgi:hypothetical protein